ncbi:hypothetical protein IFT84_01525 [Rhizobium sp. CFBP 8762]|uniref:DUF6456 domain-containing protein n=1 Tax=Rhizobium sp. CFBP 8762 TaxID=2775279 RepID=UPI00177F99DC|nr:DUF6456 domain-containing protein [Rhizobium sp. CFBP 8762]MBD8553197.1 hypothetical protein [Rhizobium sp. CFBP 8762]
MSEPKTAAMLKLLRFVMGHRVLVESRTESDIVLTRGEGCSRTFALGLVQHGLSQGLLSTSGGLLAATPTACAFIRRALVSPDEAFANQHRDTGHKTMIVEEVTESVRVNHAESPLSALARLKEKSGAPFLESQAIAAGERLLADFTRGQLQPRMTMTYAPKLESKAAGARSGEHDLSDSALSARRRVRSAVEAMGPELSGVALDICCFSKGLETVERERQWPVRSAKVMLRAALQALARHYESHCRPHRRHPEEAAQVLDTQL